MVRRLLVPMFLLPLAALIYAAPASADEAVVVLDRGRGAKAEARRYERDALRLVEALEARGIPTSLALYGTRPDGRVRAARLAGDLEDRLTRAAAKEGWRYEAPTDPRFALEVSLRGVEDSGPLLVLLVGPFEAPTSSSRTPGSRAGDERVGGRAPGREEPDESSRDGAGALPENEAWQAQAVEALAAWEAGAPPRTRVFATDLSAAGLARIAGARGVVSSGAVVLAAGEAVATPAPWSPLARSGPEAALRATLSVPLDVLTVGPGAEIPVLSASSSDGRGEVRVAPSDGQPEGEPQDAPSAQSEQTATVFSVVRARDADDGAALVETVSFDAAEDASVLWLAEPPQPRTIQWTALRPDARLSWFARREDLPPTPVDTPRPLDADPLLVDRPLVRICRIEHTRVGDAPDWRVSATDADLSVDAPPERPHRPGDQRPGDLPDGLVVTLGEVVNLTDRVAYRDLEVRLEARAGAPGTRTGALVIQAAGHPARFEVPYHVVVPPGRVVARLEAADAERRLPAAKDDEPWTLVIEEESPNAPPLVRVEADLAPPSLAAILTARLVGAGGMDVSWDLARPLQLRPGRRYALHVDLAPGVRTAEGTLSLRFPEQRGVQGRTEGRGRIGARSPRLVLAGDGAYRMRSGEVLGDPPLVLRVDADGGGGDWRMALFETAPVVTVSPGAQVAFEARPEGPGRWALLPRGDWRGTRGNTFSAREETVPVRIAWAAGAAPGDVEIRIEVRPRWGAAGWILAGLAALALALGLWGLLQMKAAPVAGTLLYQVAGRQGAVGRLDLGAAGRRPYVVVADAAGRLALAPHRRGDAAPVLVVRPTRVGGLLEIPGAAPPERHLLVDGLTVTAGRHRIRYVSARPGDATVAPVLGPEEELLGPEFDMPSGRIDALRREEPQPPE